jgi:zinc transporter ZupT
MTDFLLTLGIAWSLLVQAVACGVLIADTDWRRRADVLTTLFAVPGVLVAVVALVLMGRAPATDLAMALWTGFLSSVSGGI